MLALRDYLDLDIRDARSQWRQVLHREPRVPGMRQVAFSPIETLLCFGLGLVANQSPSGTINIPTSSRDVQALSLLLRRTPKSLAAKLANLDGRRPNGAKFEPALWIRLTNNLMQFESLYAIIIDAGRLQGLDDRVLPDFLGFDDQQLQIVYAADKVSDDDLRASIEGRVRDSVGRADINIADTERTLLGTARIGQQQFARKVLKNSGFGCVFCGLSTRAVGLPSARMLVASHVKPWSESEGHERVDPGNGLAACPTHDAAFEGYLFSIDEVGNLIRSSDLDAAIDKDSRFKHNFGLAGLATSLLLPRGSKRPGGNYISWHRQQMLIAASSPDRNGRGGSSRAQVQVVETD